MSTAESRLVRGGFLPLLVLAAVFVVTRLSVGSLGDGAGLAMEQPGTRDFVQYWAAHQALGSGRNAYDGQTLFAIEDGVGQRDDETILMWNPPWTVLLLEPVVSLPFSKAALMWELTSLILLAGIAVLLPEALGRRTPHLSVAALAVGCFYPVAQCLVWGQLSVFLTFFFVLFLHFEHKGERFAAGLSLVPLTTKPHLFFLLAIPGLLWLVQLPPRERRAFLAGAVGGSAVVVAVTALRWPAALSWWTASLSAQPTGPGAVAMELWETTTVATLLRLAIAATNGGDAPRWPIWAVPAAGFAATAAWCARNRRPVVWADVAPPVMCLSLTLGSYGWTFDQTLLLPVQMALACDAVAAIGGEAASSSGGRETVGTAVRGAGWRVAALLVAIQLFALAVGARPGASHADFIWLPWAMLAAWAFARRLLAAPASGPGSTGAAA